MRTHSSFLAILLTAAPLSLAGASNGVVHYSFEFPPQAITVDCLDVPEVLWFTYTIDAHTHEVVTPSGGYHLLDTWSITGQLVGEDTGREWITVTPSPYVSNENGATTEFFTHPIVFQPVAADTPKITALSRLKVTINANGAPTVDVLYEPRAWRCVFPKGPAG